MNAHTQQPEHMSHQEDPIDSTHHAHHILGPSVYLTVLLILLVLTAVTVAVAYFDFSKYVPHGNLIVALGLATIKATLVLLWFMHVKFSGRLIHLTIAASLMFFMIMIFGVLMDVWTRSSVEMPVNHSTHDIHVPAAESPGH